MFLPAFGKSAFVCTLFASVVVLPRSILLITDEQPEASESVNYSTGMVFRKEKIARRLFDVNFVRKLS
jgi:hypothetical protein